MQKRTSPLKFGHFAKESGLNSVSNLSTKGEAGGEGGARARAGGRVPRPLHEWPDRVQHRARTSEEETSRLLLDKHSLLAMCF